MPPKAADREGRRHPISFRATEDVRDRLERAASEAGRSLTQEIEFRLEQSFLQTNIFKAYFGAEDADEIMKELNLIVLFNLARLGKSLKGNKAAIDALRSQIDGFLLTLEDKESYDAKKSAWEAMIEHDQNAWKKFPPLPEGLTSPPQNANEQAKPDQAAASSSASTPPKLRSPRSRR